MEQSSFEKLAGFQPLKKFPAFYGTRSFITAVTSSRHRSLSWASSIQSRLLLPTSWRSSWCTANQEIVNNTNYTALMNVAHSSLLEIYNHLWETYFLHLLRGSRFPRNVFEIQTTRRHNPEYGNLWSHCRVKIESYIIMLGFYYDLQLLDSVGH